jgi:hypothetical protein
MCISSIRARGGIMTKEIKNEKTPSQIQDDLMEEVNLFFHKDYPGQEDANFKNTCLEARGGSYPYSWGKVYGEDGLTVAPGVRLYVVGDYKKT